MHTVFALLCFVVVIHWLIFPYPSGLLHWHCGNLTIAPVPAKQPWWIWINTSCDFIMNDCITTTKQSTTKPCAYFLGYTVCLQAHADYGIKWIGAISSDLCIDISRAIRHDFSGKTNIRCSHLISFCTWISSPLIVMPVKDRFFLTNGLDHTTRFVTEKGEYLFWDALSWRWMRCTLCCTFMLTDRSVGIWCAY